MAANDHKNERYIVRVMDLWRWLEKISTAGRHWQMEPIDNSNEAGECRSQICIRFSNERDIPNEIKFRFPVASISSEDGVTPVNVVDISGNAVPERPSVYLVLGSLLGAFLLRRVRRFE